MGWASASPIFDSVVIAMSRHRVPIDARVDILQSLAKELTYGDWDTWDESLEMFPHEPAVLMAFRNLGLIGEVN